MVSLSTFAPPRVGGLALRAKGVGLRGWLPTWRRTPFTIVYLTLIAAGSVLLSLLDDGDHDAVLRTSSTDVHQLSTHPIFVLVTSAVWVDGIVDGLDIAQVASHWLSSLHEKRLAFGPPA